MEKKRAFSCMFLIAIGLQGTITRRVKGITDKQICPSERGSVFSATMEVVKVWTGDLIRMTLIGGLTLTSVSHYCTSHADPWINRAFSLRNYRVESGPTGC